MFYLRRWTGDLSICCPKMAFAVPDITLMNGLGLVYINICIVVRQFNIIPLNLLSQNRVFWPFAVPLLAFAVHLGKVGNSDTAR